MLRVMSSSLTKLRRRERTSGRRGTGWRTDGARLEGARHLLRDERRRHGDRVEQVVVNGVGKDNAQHHGGQHGDHQVDRKTTRLGLCRQPGDNVQNFAPELPDHGQDGTELNDDVERHGSLTTEIEQVCDDDLVACTGDGQKLRQPLNKPQDDRFQ